MRHSLGARSATAAALLFAAAGGAAGAPERPVVHAALRFFADHGVLPVDEFFRRIRPESVTVRDRESILAGLPRAGTLAPGTFERSRFTAAQRVLAYHARHDQITFRLVDVPSAWVGLHLRAVVLVSARLLVLVSAEEFVALVAHEVGHEYVWSEFAKAVARQDMPRLQELELRCDGIAVLTLRRLAIDPERLVSALRQVTWYNEVRGHRANAGAYVPLGERVRFIREIDRISRTRAMASSAHASTGSAGPCDDADC